MDNQRIILFVALAFVVMLIWQEWEKDHALQSQKPQTEKTSSATALDVPADVPISPPPAMTSEKLTDTPHTPFQAVAVQQAKTSVQHIHIVSDLLDLTISAVGGDVIKAGLLAYPVDVDHPDKAFRLLEDVQGGRVFTAQSGLLSKSSAPDHYAVYHVKQEEFHLAPDADKLVVPLYWNSSEGIEVIKTYTLHRNSYQIDVQHEIKNNSAQSWLGHQYRQFKRTAPSDKEKSAFIYTYTGGVIYSDEKKYEKIDFAKMADQNLSRNIVNGWAAMIQHYFAAAWIPDKDEINHFYSKAPDGRPYVLGMVSPEKTVAANTSDTFYSKLYVGPKEYDRLVDTAKGLELTVDYGILTFISRPLFVVLKYINGVVGNWGWAIILLTLCIKLIFFKLSAASYKSMANMRRLQPRIIAMKERYGDDKQGMTKAMMDLYKKEKVNPMGGCLPMLVQIPVFIALYWALLESVELRQSGFIFWIHDLSTKDPYYILPLLMGVTMFLQQKLNPAPPDPIQAKVMMALPFIFTVFFAFFPSGLVLYWVANSVLSILQQWYITRRIENAAKQ